jgi:hypothetical protein
LEPSRGVDGEFAKTADARLFASEKTYVKKEARAVREIVHVANVSM